MAVKFDTMLGALRELDGTSGTPGPQGPAGPDVDRNPILSAGNAVSDGKRRVWLGSDADTMTFFDDQYDVTKVVLRLVSADTGVTGNIVLIPSIDDEAQTAVVVPVGSTVAAVELPFAGVDGHLSIRRDCEDSRDTLRDGAPVAAVVVVWEVHHG